MSFPQGTQILALTAKYNGISNQIITEVEISIPNVQYNIKVKAIWDTGATASVITQKVVDALGLKPSGMSDVFTANGATRQNTYIVNIALPNKVTVQDVTVTGAPSFSSGCDVLIGMDIIGLGDFSITNWEGKTCMSFRFPSCHEIDYVQKLMQGIKPAKQPSPGTHGSNQTPKKKKRK